MVQLCLQPFEYVVHSEMIDSIGGHWSESNQRQTDFQSGRELLN